MNPTSFIPLPIVRAKINRVHWIPVLRRQKSVNFLKPSIQTDRIQYLKGDSKKIEQKTTPKEYSFFQKFVNFLQPRRNDRETIKVTTIVERIRRRSKRHVEPQIETAPSNGLIFSKNRMHSGKIRNADAKFENSVIPPRRRRSTVDVTAKDRKTRTGDTRRDGNKSRKPFYTPVFKECNDTTAASEIEDLNILPSRSKYSKPQISSDGEKIIDHTKIDDQNRKLSALESAGGGKKLVKSPSFTREQSGYVNLRDHQEESRSKNQSGDTGRDSSTLGYPKDIKPYNPDIIPYVDVPDYTDQREESLDEDDRRAAKEKHSLLEKNSSKRTGNVNDDDDDVDVVDPDGPEANESLPNPPKNPESSRNRNKSKSFKDRYKDAQSLEEKISNPSSRNTKQNENHDPLKEDEFSSQNKDREIEKQSRPLQKSQSLQIVNDDDGKVDKVEEEIEYRREDDTGPTFNFEPVNFDISHHAKPFNYHKSLKDEKRHDDEREEEFISEDLPESSHEMFSEQYEKFVAAKPEDFHFEDTEFFQPISAHAHDKSDNFNEESDFLAKYFTPDVIGQFENSGDDKFEGKKSLSLEEDNEESHETLSSNLRSENRHVPDKTWKMNKKEEPKDYKKFWTLEYSFPPKKTKNY